ncbi:hypothetical protein AVL59_45520 [Streptomyces griseochromogenes]|uniref:Uncharacterized protein n=1 Tax=Streptomyces griseochromogenes TaxID=68214 RepID=A0A1B1BAQ5_9ACTN|nr:hypothetical protein AVL59_45520 [Streptomyces griseochromogenes]
MFARPGVGQDGPGTDEHLFTRAELGIFHVVSEQGEPAVIAVGAEMAGLALGRGPGQEAERVRGRGLRPFGGVHADTSRR